MMYSAYKLNKQGDSIQPCLTLCPILKHHSMSGFNYCFLTRIQVSHKTVKVVWYSHLFKNFPQFVYDIHRQGFGVVNKAKVDVILELSYSFDDLADVGNLVSGSSAFSKSSLNMWKFTIHILLKPGLENFDHYFASVWDECSCMVVWIFFGIAFPLDWNENWLGVIEVNWVLAGDSRTSAR